MKGRLPSTVEHCDIGSPLYKHLANIFAGRKEERSLPMPVRDVNASFGKKKRLDKLKVAIKRGCVKRTDTLGVLFVGIRTSLE
jgi:hypothetical protein